MAVLATLALCASVDAQKPSAPFRSGVDAVYLDVTVFAGDGTIITGLTKDDFEIFDEGVEHEVAIFSDEPSPISVGILIDASRSMTGDRMEAAIATAAAMGRALKPQDLWSVAVFNSYLNSLIGWRPYDDSVIPTLEKIRVRGNTELFRSVADFAKRMGETPHRRKAMLVITDGADDVVQAQRHARAGRAGDGAPMLIDHTERAVKALQTGEVLVYGLGLDWGATSSVSALHVPSLKTLADPTGGAVAVARSLADVEGAAGALANELRQQYTLGFYPQKAPDGKYRRIEVKSKNPNYRVRTRAGYLAGSRK